MLSVSGARGIVGESMTAEVAARFARAFAAEMKHTRTRGVAPLVVLGRDSRPSGAELARAVAGGLIESGFDVLDLGLVMTPTVGVMVRELGAAGGLVITASHNPAQWNGIKCLNQEGAAPPTPVAKRIVERFQSGCTEAQCVGCIPGTRPPSCDISANSVHLNRVFDALGAASLARVRGRRFKVVFDSINGAGSVIGRSLLESLGCTVRHLNGTPNGDFAHAPEPLEENLHELCAAVEREKADIGFAQDPDGDRLAIVDEMGRCIGEEYTLALCALRALERETGTKARRHEGTRNGIVLAANLSTSRMIDDVAARFPAQDVRVEVLRTAVGEANVVEALMAARAEGRNALLGGEGNGGVIYPDVCWVRDSLISMALVLDILASRRVPAAGTPELQKTTSLSDVVNSLPRYTMIKRKLDLSALGGREAVAPMLANVKAEFSDRAKHPDARINDSDGIRIDFHDGWVHLRPSNTEPIVRLIAEGGNPASCETLIACVQSVSTPPPAT
jgi:phosphomannomutase